MIRRVKALPWILTISSLALSVSCASFGKAAAVNTSIKFEGVRIENPARQGLAVVDDLLGAVTGAPSNGGEAGLSLTLLLYLENKNPFTINLARVTYTFLVDGKIVATGSKDGKDGRMAFAPGEGKTVEAPARIFTLELIGHALNGLTGKEAAFEVKGELTFETVFGEIAVPYQAEKKM